MRRLITRATLVTPDAVVPDASVLIEDDRIAALCPVAPTHDAVLDARGALCLPGLVDLHCDALEKEVEPRPRVAFPHDLALASSDRRNLNAGITTVYHAVSFAGGEWGVRDNRIAAQVVAAVRDFRGLVDHRVHARYEITDVEAGPAVEELIRAGICDLVSFMDHSPGQGQFRELSAYVAYMVRTYHTTESEAVRLGEAKVAARTAAAGGMARLAGTARAHGVALASHDDDTPEKVAAMAALGVTISEFPIGLAAARAAVAAGMVTVMGAPNVVRGGSSSGNVKALDVILAGACTGLCADYHPPSLLQAVFALPNHGLSLPAAVRLATRDPALAAGLGDRGALQPGLLADLLLVRAGAGPVQVETVLTAGRVVLDTVDRAVARGAACA